MSTNTKYLVLIVYSWLILLTGLVSNYLFIEISGQILIFIINNFVIVFI